MLYQKHLSNQVQYRLHHPEMPNNKKRLPSNEVIKDGYNSLLMKQGIDPSTGEALNLKKNTKASNKNEATANLHVAVFRLKDASSLLCDLVHTLCDENAPKRRKKEAAKLIQRRIIPLVDKAAAVSRDAATIISPISSRYHVSRRNQVRQAKKIKEAHLEKQSKFTLV